MSESKFETWATDDPEYRSHRTSDEDRIRAALASPAVPPEGLPNEQGVHNWPGGGGRVTKDGTGDPIWRDDPDGAWVVLYAPRRFYDGLLASPAVPHQPCCTDATGMPVPCQHPLAAAVPPEGLDVDAIEQEAGRLLVEAARIRAARLGSDDAHELRHLWAAINAGNSDPCGVNGESCHLDVEAIRAWTAQYPHVMGLSDTGERER